MNPINQIPRIVFAVDHFSDGLTDVEKRVSLILKEMEEGFRVDAHTLMNLKSSYESSLVSLNEEMQSKLGNTVKVNSNRELGDLLFNNFRLPPLRRTPTGHPSVSIEILERLGESYAESFPFLKPLIELKKVQPLAKSIKTIFKKLDPNGRIHPEFNQCGCPTGRVYSYIQNLPKEVRKVLIPDEEGNVFIELDWSQQELRILGALSGEPIFLDCFASNQDLHKRVISEMFHKPISEVTSEERKVGKTINYALIYGQEAPGLAWNLNISLDKAKELINRYFSSLPSIQKFKQGLRERFLKEGYSETVFGRKTQLDLNGPKRERELRRGFNHIFQGTGADLLKATLIRSDDHLKNDRRGKLKFCSHDAIYLESKREFSQEIGDEARSIMEIDFMGVHLPVTVKIHRDFSMGGGVIRKTQNLVGRHL